MFVRLEYFDDWVSNLLVLLNNRKKELIYVMTNNLLKLVTAQHLGFCILPVTNSTSSRPFELKLLEKFIINLKNNKNARVFNLNDFNFLNLNSKTFQIIQNMPEVKIIEQELENMVNEENSVITFRKGTGKFIFDDEKKEFQLVASLSYDNKSNEISSNVIHQYSKSHNLE